MRVSAMALPGMPTRTTATDCGRTMEAIDLPAEPQAVARARRFVADVASGHVEDPGVLLLLTSELVTNVVRHARTELTVRVGLGPPLRVEVQDGVAATEAFRDLIARRPAVVARDSLGGRGISLVHDLAVRIGLDDDASGGKVVWFEL